MRSFLATPSLGTALGRGGYSRVAKALVSCASWMQRHKRGPWSQAARVPNSAMCL